MAVLSSTEKRSKTIFPKVGRTGSCWPAAGAGALLESTCLGK